MVVSETHGDSGGLGDRPATTSVTKPRPATFSTATARCDRVGPASPLPHRSQNRFHLRPLGCLRREPREHLEAAHHQVGPLQPVVREAGVIVGIRDPSRGAPRPACGVLPCVRRALTLPALAFIGASISLTAQAPRGAAYAAVGAELTQYEIDSDGGTLTNRRAVTLPANVQEAALHPSRRYLYVGWSSTGASYGDLGGAPDGQPRHGVTAFCIDAALGALVAHGRPIRSARARFT